MWYHSRNRGYDIFWAWALGSASGYITHETLGTICYGHWGLHLAISHTRQRVRSFTDIGFCILWYLTRDRKYDLFRALGSASCDITHETGGTICFGHRQWVLHLVISHTRQGVRFVAGIGFCFCEITHETGGTICYRHCVLHLAISPTRQRVRFVTDIGFCILWYHTRLVTGSGFCILWYHTRDGGYDLLRALGSASYDLTHETEGTACYGHWVLHLVITHAGHVVRFDTVIVFRILWDHIRDRAYHLLLAGILHLLISHTRQGRYDSIHALGSAWGTGYSLLRALGSASCDIACRGTICYGRFLHLVIPHIWLLWYQAPDRWYDGHWVLHLFISPMNQRRVRFFTGKRFCILWLDIPDMGYDLLPALCSASCDILHKTRGRICYRLWVLLLWYHPGDRGNDVLRTLGSASCAISHETGGTICYGHWVLRLVKISHARQRVTICYGHWVLHLEISRTRQGVRLCSARYDITHETGGTTCYGHWVLHLAISQTRQGVRFVTSIGVFI